MKKIIFSAVVIASVLVSCNNKNKDATAPNQNMGNDGTMMNNDSTMTVHDSTMMDNTKMINNTKMIDNKIYACPMHPEVQGKLNDKCPKCGMKLTKPVPEKTK